MKNLTKLFRLLEITRAQPQYGYVLAEIPKSDLSDLAQHHYLVTFMAWQLGRLVQRAGAKVNLERILEFGLIHDLGELFGGDISMPYAQANPAARTAAKAFEAENQKYLSQFFGQDQAYFQALADEIMDAKTDEAIIAKVADYVEVTHYKLYVHRLSQNDIKMIVNKLKVMITKMTDQTAREKLLAFLTEWSAQLADGQLEELFELAKSNGGKS